MRASRILAGLVAVALTAWLLDVAPAAAQRASIAAVGPPTIDATLGSVEVFGCNFAPNDSVTVTIKDAPAGTTLFQEAVPTGGGGCFQVGGGLGGPQLAVGMFVQVTDGVTTKELTLVDVTIDLIDRASDVITGTAPASAEVDLHVSGPSGDVQLTVNASGAGVWSHDFTGELDITGESEAFAAVPDGDGDRTGLSRRAPSIQLSPTFDQVLGEGFAADSSVIVDIFDAPTGNLLFTEEFPTGGIHGIGGFSVVALQHGQDLVPGMHIEATDGVTSLELTLDELGIDDVNPATDVVSGTASPGAQVALHLFGPPGDFAVAVAANGVGAWSHDFTGEFPVTVDTGVRAEIGDADGDRTVVERGAPSIRGSLTSDSVKGCGLDPEATVTLTIRTAPGGTLLFTGDVPADGAGCFALDRGAHDVDLVAGNHLIVTDGTLTRRLTLVDLTMDLDFATDTGSGIAPPGADVRLEFGLPERGDGFTTTADGTGNWSLDFGENVPPGAEWSANVIDGDGDRTAVDRPPTIIEVHLDRDTVGGCGFTADASATVRIRETPVGTILFTGPSPTDAEGCFQMGRSQHGEDLVPGMFVRAISGDASAEHTLADLTVDAIDAGGNKVTGTAPPGEFVHVHMERWDGTGATGDLLAAGDGTGAWTAVFGVFDVTVAMIAEASASDAQFDFDVTVTDKLPPACFRDGAALVIGGSPATLRRSGNDLRVTGLGLGDPTCGGATVFNVDTVRVPGDPAAQSLTIDLSGGPLAPGATAEGAGASEIELVVDFGPGDTLVLRGSASRDALNLGALGINVNGDGDADVSRPAGPAVFGNVAVNGGSGDDLISAAGSAATGGAYPASLTVDGQGGNDMLTGGSAADSLTGGSGIDQLVEARDGNFTLTNSSLTSGPSTDSLSGIDRATLTGGAGANTINTPGFTGQVTLNGQGGNDLLTAGPAADSVTGGAGDDQLTAGGGTNSVAGGPGVDRLVEAGDVNFTLTNTSVAFGSSSASLTGIERATLTAGAGPNTINASGFTGQVSLNGQGGDDVLTAGPGPDSLFGAGGNDTMAGRQGQNALSGGLGLDRVLYDWSGGAVRVNLSAGTATGASFSDLLSGIENAVGSNHNDVLSGNGAPNVMTGVDGNDTIDVRDGVRGNDVAAGGSGVDRCSTDVGDTRTGCEL